MMKGLVRNTLTVTVSNIIMLLSSIVVSLGLPKLMSINEYGDFKIFTLYSVYIGLLHLGLLDGIYIKYAGKDYDNLDKSRFRIFSRFLFCLEMTFSILILCLIFIFKSAEIRFIIILLAINLVIHNMYSFYLQILQFTQKYREFLVINTLYAIIRLCVIGVLVFIKQLKVIAGVSNREYLLIYTLTELFLLLCCIVKEKDLVFGKCAKWQECKGEILYLIKSGLPILISGVISTLILNIDKQYVSILFNSATYAQYAFAYSMLSLVTTMISSISVVLYPALKNINKVEIEKQYNNLSLYLSMIIFAGLCFTGIINKFISWFLPVYGESGKIFIILLPGIALSCIIEAIIKNYYKMLNMTGIYLKKVVWVLVFAACSNAAAYVLFRNPFAISAASVITYIFWYVSSEKTLLKKTSITVGSCKSYLILLSSAYYIIFIFINNAYSTFYYMAVYLLVTILWYKNKRERG